MEKKPLIIQTDFDSDKEKEYNRRDWTHEIAKRDLKCAIMKDSNTTLPNEAWSFGSRGSVTVGGNVMMCSDIDNIIMLHRKFERSVLEILEVIIFEVIELATMLLWLTRVNAKPRCR